LFYTLSLEIQHDCCKTNVDQICLLYMSNILFSKKFLAKITAIIRNFWWTGVREEPSTKSLCLKAWADICTDKKIGGLGIRNLQAINQGLILSAAWRLAKDPQSQLAQILKAKYHHDTSIWRAKPNKPKSAFWTAILKVQPLLFSASFYQLIDGSSSVWSSPWFIGWESIYDNLIIQATPYAYPAVVRDLWIPNEKTWNINLVNSLFSPHTAHAILQTPIINTDGQDTLVWKLTPTGMHSSKSAYKHCFNNLALPVNQQPKVVPQQITSLLNQVWQDKTLAPRVQTFAWRLLRRALPTGKRASRFSKHIEPECSRCGCVEDEMHLLFLCPFSKAAWFCHPWYVNVEHFAVSHQSVPDMIQGMLSSRHPHASITNLYTFLWCLWKARNDTLFGRKQRKPSQIFASTNAVLQGYKLEDTTTTIEHKLEANAHSHQIIPTGDFTRDPSACSVAIFSDAAWKQDGHSQPSPAGIGIVVQVDQNKHFKQLHISALSPPASSALQAEAFALLLATRLVGALQLQEPCFFTDSSVLAKAATATSLFAAPGHWAVRPQIAAIQANPTFQTSRISHINRSANVKAHHQARLATKIQNRSLAIRCLSSDLGHCPGKDVLAGFSVTPFRLLSVKCS
jgi:ribonuclease HI